MTSPKPPKDNPAAATTDVAPDTLTTAPARAAQGPLHVSRLIQLLQQLHLSDKPVATHNVAEKLGGLIDLSLSVSLADTLRSLERIPGGDSPDEARLLRQQLLEERGKWLQQMVRACDPANDSISATLPRLAPDHASRMDEIAQTYARFYSLQQSEMDYRIMGFQRRVRQVLTDASPAMAQLATLDKALFSILAQQTRKAFATLPPLIGRHLLWHYQQQPTSTDDDPDVPRWFRALLRDLQEILLAELDIRLQPVIGLIEACEADIGY